MEELSNVQKADSELRAFMTSLVERHKLTTYETVAILETAKTSLIIVGVNAAMKISVMARMPGA